MSNAPQATYRLQFHKDFTFRDATELAPYLARLGISHVYASPYLMARPGSNHGYDIIDHNRLNPEIGDEADYAAFTQALAAHGLKQVLDIVPNHMGVGMDNQWWLDVLEHGLASPYAEYFDIDWRPLKPELKDKLLLPVLGDHYGLVLERGELKLVLDQTSGCFNAYYFDNRFPIDPRTYVQILQPVLDGLSDPQTADAAALRELIEALRQLPPHESRAPEDIETRRRQVPLLKQRLAALDLELRAQIERQVEAINAACADEPHRNLLHRLLEAQAWRLANWRTASDEINYRRFFDINELAGIRMEREEVFEATHGLILKLIAEGKIHGLRLDHPDGLYDPKAYFKRLNQRACEAAGCAEGEYYIVVEKILAEHEHLREDWPVSGTSGYDTMRLLNGLFIDGANLPRLERIYQRFSRRRQSFEEVLDESKRLIMQDSLASELNVLATRLNRISEVNPKTRDFTLSRLRAALQEYVASFPVYRTYVDNDGPAEQDLRYIHWALRQARKRHARGEVTIYDFLQRVLCLDAPDLGEAERQIMIDFAMRLQQYTAPVMAKGFEDTTFYRYFPLASLNEVGGNPSRGEVTPTAFHHLNRERLRRWPGNMLASSTHDTKRSEDVRARLNVLSEIPALWQPKLTRWSRLNRRHRTELETGSAPSRNHEYLLYQTLIGSWPLEPLDDDGWATYVERIDAYMAKASHEGKLETSWFAPDPDYDQALSNFVHAILDRGRSQSFIDDLQSFQQPLARLGLYNSLAQTLLKLTAPGVPDIYQGTDLWDFSLVDPDNRRPVDYPLRVRLLASLQERAREPAALTADLLAHLEDGSAKLYLIWQVLNLRRAQPLLFSQGDYVSLAISGTQADHVLAYARVLADQVLIVVVPRLLYQLTEGASRLPIGEIWADTQIDLRSLKLEGKLHEILSGGELTLGTEPVAVAELLTAFPVAVWRNAPR